MVISADAITGLKLDEKQTIRFLDKVYSLDMVISVDGANAITGLKLDEKQTIRFLVKVAS
jgi:hypothetical protein